MKTKFVFLVILVLGSFGCSSLRYTGKLYVPTEDNSQYIHNDYSNGVRFIVFEF